jgi:hypothetical protein
MTRAAATAIMHRCTSNRIMLPDHSYLPFHQSMRSWAGQSHMGGFVYFTCGGFHMYLALSSIHAVVGWPIPHGWVCVFYMWRFSHVLETVHRLP